MSRKEAREVIMKYLYQMEINEDYSLDRLQYLYNDRIDEDDINFIDRSLKSIVLNLNDLDQKIDKFLKGWKSNRIPKIDLAILRLAINEIDNL
ncbi:MAG: transcription antitermination factor NusB, partial [Tissierellia bacterium]|nr:transcription antitermination factor NusB [Tissierellia bacterium]